MHVFITWKWKQPGFREPYLGQYVNVMHRMLHRHTTIPFRHICITDDETNIQGNIETFPLWKDMEDKPNYCGHHLPSCYRRLKIFSPIVQKQMGIRQGDRLVSIDLDAILVRNCDHLWRRPERFVGWARRGSRQPTVFNGSMFMWNAGDLEYLWTEFEPDRSPAEANKAGFLGSDQSWLSYKLMHEPFIGGFGATVQSYPTELRRLNKLPNHTSLVFFHGRQKPWHPQTQHEAAWVAEHWRA